jgi:hypothetical protein
MAPGDKQAGRSVFVGNIPYGEHNVLVLFFKGIDV